MSDDDKRPQISGKVSTHRANIELSVRGSQDESSEDISSLFDDKLDKLLESSDIIAAEEDDGGNIMHQ